MTENVGDVLRDADPVRYEAELTSEEVYTLRRAVLVRRHYVPRAGLGLSGRVLLPASIALAALIGGGMLAWLLPPSPPLSRAVERQQLQFETPNGTRVIWLLNPDFGL